MKISHVGVVVPSIRKALPYWLACGYEIEIAETFDPLQNIFCCLLVKDETLPIELVAPSLSGPNPLISRLAKGGGIDHICYEVERLEESLLRESQLGSRIVCQPIFAETFNRRVGFIVNSGGLLVEYMEVLSQ
jgi:methylmalonyl-CoA/ethylmalonyl-CoA epimerase